MEMIPAKVLGIEAVMPDGTIEGKSTALPPDASDAWLTDAEQGLMVGVRHDFPTATEYRSTGWVDTFVFDENGDGTES